MDRTVDNIEEPQIDENLEQEVQEPESRETVIEKIKSKISNFMGNAQEEEAGEPVPEGFAEAAQNLGWSAEDIAEFADGYSDEELLEMIPSLVVEEPEESEPPAETPEEEEKEVEDSQEDEKIQKLLARIDALEKAQETVNDQNKKQEDKNRVKKASSLFDKLSDEYEVFGKTEGLPRFPDGRLVPNSPALKARNEVWNVAHSLAETGMAFDSAMDVAVNAYKGKHLAADVKRNMIKDLKNHESKLSGKHTSHESQEYADLSGPDVIREVARRHGREIM
jgi:hypothetical protein